MSLAHDEEVYNCGYEDGFEDAKNEAIQITRSFATHEAHEDLKARVDNLTVFMGKLAKRVDATQAHGQKLESTLVTYFLETLGR